MTTEQELMETQRQLIIPHENVSLKTHDHVRFANVEMNQVIPFDEESYNNSGADVSGKKFSKFIPAKQYYVFYIAIISLLSVFRLDIYSTNWTFIC